jgi:hypothetical protein
LRVEKIPGMHQPMQRRARLLQKVLTQVRRNAVWNAFSGIPADAFLLCPRLLRALEASS